MESVPLEMDDIFGDNDEGEDNYPGPLADLPEELEPSQNRDATQDAENNDVLSKLNDLKGAAKKTVRRPLPKLDGTRLTGERGIPILPKLFEDVKFKGKGHEKQDLKTIIDKLEHWGHRLFPKLPFDEVLWRIEKLGAKKEVQTCIKKMRQDMPILAADFGGGNDGSNDEEVEEKPVEEEAQINKVARGSQDNGDLDAEEAFDEMMRQEASQRPAPPPKPTSPPKTAKSPPKTATSPPKTATILSEEQKERIERNKRIALEKRLARLGQTPTSASSPKPTLSADLENSISDISDTPSKASTLEKPKDILKDSDTGNKESDNLNRTGATSSQEDLLNSENVQNPTSNIESVGNVDKMNSVSLGNSQNEPEQPMTVDENKNKAESPTPSELKCADVNIESDDVMKTPAIVDVADNINSPAIVDVANNINSSAIVDVADINSSPLKLHLTETMCDETDKDSCSSAAMKINNSRCYENQNSDVAMETDDQQTAEEILNDLDNL